jgi:hypothetical protein
VGWTWSGVDEDWRSVAVGRGRPLILIVRAVHITQPLRHTMTRQQLPQSNSTDPTGEHELMFNFFPDTIRVAAAPRGQRSGSRPQVVAHHALPRLVRIDLQPHKSASDAQHTADEQDRVAVGIVHDEFAENVPE